MNRDVMSRQMFRNGGPVYMQDGGMAPMPMDQGAMPMDQGAMPPPMPAPMMPPQDIEAEAARMAQEQMDPAMMEQLLGGYAQSLGGMENEGDYAAVIDGIRGNSLPMAGRYEELAGLVGPEDAQQTPESVLALVQPTLMLAEAEASGVDEGIGGLAPAIMDTPIEGPMAEGIMSTVGAAGPAPDAMMPPMGGSEPVNFNRGGAVQYFSAGGPVQYFENGGETAGQANAPYAVDPRLQELYGQNQAFYGSLIDPRQQEAALEEQTRMTKAGILFDIAQGALSFAGRKEGDMSTGERLAQSFSPVIGSIGERAAGLSQFKQGQAAEKRKINMMSAQAAQSQFDAFRVKQGAPADPGNLSRITYTDENGEPVTMDGPNTVYQFSKILKAHPDAKMIAIPKTADLKTGWVSLFPIGGGKPVPVNLATQEGRDRQNELMATENYSLTKPDNDFTVYYDNTGENRRPRVLDTTTSEGLAEARKLVESGGWSKTEPKMPDPYNLKQVTFTQPVTIDGKTYKAGDSTNLTQEQLAEYANAYTDYVPTQQPDIYNLKRVTFTQPVTIGDKTYEEGDSTNLNEEQQAEYANAYTDYVPAKQSDPYNLTEVTFTRPVTIDGETYKKGDSTNLTEEQLAKYANSYTEYVAPKGTDYIVRTVKIDGYEKSVFVDKNNPDAAPIEISSSEIAVTPDYKKVSLTDAEGIVTSTIVDLTTADGRAALAQVNDANKRRPGSASIKRVGTESVAVKTLVLPDTREVVTSYDGGNTYSDADGVPRTLQGTQAYEISNTVSNGIYEKLTISKDAQKQLNLIDEKTAQNMVDPSTGEPILKQDAALVSDTLEMVRNGTGLFSNISAALNGVIGGTFAPETFSKVFKDSSDGRQFVKLIRIMGRSALASSPRFAVADLAVTSELFVNENDLFVNPVTELKKLQNLASYLSEEKIRLLTVRAEPGGKTGTMLAEAGQKLQEIERLQSILGPILSGGVKQASTRSVEDAVELMTKKARRK